jgi:hypothetical protein
VKIRRTMFYDASMSIATALLMIGSPTIAGAASMPFSFEVSGQAEIVGTPSASMLDLPTTVTGSISYNPFGTATYFETGTATFVMLPSGDFGLDHVMNAFLHPSLGVAIHFRERILWSSGRVDSP